MPGDNFKKRQSGDPFIMKAPLYNALVDVAQQAKQTRHDIDRNIRADYRQSGIILVRNDSLADRERFDILGLKEPVITPTENLDEFQRQVAMSGVMPRCPTYDGRFAVLLEAIPKGEFGRAVVSGVVQCRLVVDDEWHGFAEILDGRAGVLGSADLGSAKILWKEEGTGTKWAIVRLSNPQDLAACSSTSTTSPPTTTTDEPPGTTTTVPPGTTTTGELPTTTTGELPTTTTGEPPQTTTTDESPTTTTQSPGTTTTGEFATTTTDEPPATTTTDEPPGTTTTGEPGTTTTDEPPGTTTTGDGGTTTTDEPPGTTTTGEPGTTTTGDGGTTTTGEPPGTTTTGEPSTTTTGSSPTTTTDEDPPTTTTDEPPGTTTTSDGDCLVYIPPGMLIDCQLHLPKARLLIEDGRLVCEPVGEDVFDIQDCCVCGDGSTSTTSDEALTTPTAEIIVVN